MSEFSEKLIKDFSEADDVRDAGLTEPDEIIAYKDIAYGADEKWQVLDVYRPKARA